jgi:hypothetical protein
MNTPTKPTSKFDPSHELTAHPIADIFPVMEGPEFDAMVEDIKTNGLREPITLYEDKILDGRNRYRAVIKANRQYSLKEENFRPYSGSDPLGFVISANLHRRHLNESQRALIAGKLVTTKLGDNQHKKGFTIEDAAKTFKVSEASVKTAKRVEENAAPEIKEKVRSGELRLNAAKAIIEKPKDQQQAELDRIEGEREIAKAKRKAEKDAAKGNASTKPKAKTNQAMKDVDEFKAKWQTFTEMQRKAFVISFKDELAELLDYVRQQEAMIGGATAKAA